MKFKFLLLYMWNAILGKPGEPTVGPLGNLETLQKRNEFGKLEERHKKMESELNTDKRNEKIELAATGVQGSALALGALAASFGVAVTAGAGAPLVPAVVGLFAGVGFKLAAFVRWCKTLDVNEEYVRLLDYMYFAKLFIESVNKLPLPDNYVQLVHDRVDEIIKGIQNHKFNNTPPTANNFRRRFVNQFNRMLFHKTALKVQEIESFISVSAHEIEYLVIGVLIYAFKNGIDLKGLDLDIKPIHSSADLVSRIEIGPVLPAISDEDRTDSAETFPSPTASESSAGKQGFDSPTESFGVQESHAFDSPTEASSGLQQAAKSTGLRNMFPRKIDYFARFPSSTEELSSTRSNLHSDGGHRRTRKRRNRRTLHRAKKQKKSRKHR